MTTGAPTTGIAMLGCGYVANMYRLTLPMHPELTLVGVHDLEQARAETTARLSGAKVYPDLAALCADPAVSIVLNLTNPRAHYLTTKALLEAGKHVYTEKPVAMEFPQARELAALAEARGLMLTSAPCTLLAPPAQTLWKAVRERKVGEIRLVYAEMEDGPVHRAPTAKWINEAGVAWPAVDEFEIGCTVEHAGYVLTWLCAMFGPAVTVDAFSAELAPDKVPGLDLVSAPDFSVACVRFRSGVVARLTNGLIAEHDHALRLFGDEGVLSLPDPRSDRAPVSLRRYRTLRRRRWLAKRAETLPLLGGKEKIAQYRGSQTRDFCRAIADMAAALREKRPPRLGTRFALHVTELTLACHYATHPAGAPLGYGRGTYRVETDFPDVEPMPWAM
jgi:predicted dehydrogenase